MSSDRFQKASELLCAALEMDSEQRPGFLKQACNGDESLLLEVESLLAAHFQAGQFIQTPPFQNAIDLLSDQEERLSSGEQIGAYKIVREIGRGGMGAVYLAERSDEQYKKYVAIKLLKRGMDTDDLLRHFRRERQILATFDHPNIARLHDGGSTETGLPYFVMEYVEGKPIDDYCDEHTLNITQCLELFQQVCGAVTYAHRHLVIHRDIKPSNIVVTAEGIPKLLDFGIAKILQSEASGEAGVTVTNMHMMTPEFASPEQVQGFPVTTASDVYSLGVVLYELLTGCSPYRFTSRVPLEVARIITTTDLQLPSAMITAEAKAGSTESFSKLREGSLDRLRRRLQGDLDNIVLMALRKEPERRYQSVEQFSEDIHRHLQGLPVFARKDTFSYRASKFVQRNKVAVAAFAFAILALVVSATAAGIIQWRANQQAKLFQEFGQEVSHIEAIMRYAYLLPLHDVQQEKKQVADRLEYVKRRMQTLGNLAYGPGYYSLGRGYLALHSYQDAYDHLMRAWQEHNYREKPVANALGLALAMLYQEKLNEVEQLYSKEELKKRKEELGKKYRDSAQQFILQGASVSEAPEYVDALLAFLGKRYLDALEKAETAERKISWHYESKKLQADILSAMGNEQRIIGNSSQATDQFIKAKSAYLDAAKKGQSDPQIYEGLCALQSSIQEMQLDEKGTLTEALVQEGVQYCEKALTADSKSITANLFAAEIYINLAYDQYLHGDDSEKATESAGNYARAALKIDPENAFAYRALGNAYKNHAGTELERGENPIRSLQIATESLEKAIKKMPENADLVSDLGVSHIIHAQYDRNNNKDPRPAIEKAIHALNKAVELNPEAYRPFSNLGVAYCSRGVYEEEAGLDPRSSFSQSILNSKKSTELNPKYVNAYVWTALANIELAEAQRSWEQDPTPALDEAILFYRKSLILDPQNTYATHGIGGAFLVKARYMHHLGKDAFRELATARDAYRKTLRLNDKPILTYALLGQLEILAAENAIAQHKSPEQYFDAAHRILAEGLAINQDSLDCLTTMTSFYLLRVEYLSSLNKSSSKEIGLGIQFVNRALKENSQMPQVHVHRGQLFLYLCRSLSGTERIECAKTALDSFNTAFKINEDFRKKYVEVWEEAKRLAEE